MTWDDLTSLVYQKMKIAGCHSDELEIEFIDCGTYPEERNLDIVITEHPSTYKLIIEWHF